MAWLFYRHKNGPAQCRDKKSCKTGIVRETARWPHFSLFIPRAFQAKLWIHLAISMSINFKNVPPNDCRCLPKHPVYSRCIQCKLFDTRTHKHTYTHTVKEKKSKTCFWRFQFKDRWRSCDRDRTMFCFLAKHLL